MNLQGTYSSRFKDVQRDHIENLKAEKAEERQDLLARSKRLQNETNRRRKQLAVKRKLEAQREEQRRQTILAKRRDQIREATEKFQRQNRDYSRTNVSSLHPGKPAPGLDDALRAVRGSPAPSPTSAYAPNQYRHNAAISRQNSASSVRAAPSGGSINGNSTPETFSHTGSSNSTTRGTFPDRMEGYDRTYQNNYGNSAYKSDRVQEHARQVAARAELQSKSLRNMTNSRSLFEQQLEQHQQLLLDQQRQSLLHFNSAIRQEIDEDKRLQGVMEENDAELVRGSSPCSADSLDGEQSHPGNSHTQPSTLPNGAARSSQSDPLLNYGNRTVAAGVYTTTPSAAPYTTTPSAAPYTTTSDLNVTYNSSPPTSFVLHRSSSASPSSNIAVVQPQQQTPVTSGVESRLLFTPKKQQGTNSYPDNTREQLQLEDACEQVTDPLDHNIPKTLPVSSNKLDTYTPTTAPSGGQYYSQSTGKTATSGYYISNYSNMPSSDRNKMSYASPGAVTSTTYTGQANNSHFIPANTSYVNSNVGYTAPANKTHPVTANTSNVNSNVGYTAPASHTSYAQSSSAYGAQHTITGPNSVKPVSSFSRMDVDRYQSATTQQQQARQKAWATPSPVVHDEGKRVAPSVVTTTNSYVSHTSPYSSRPTATNMTTTTDYANTAVPSGDTLTNYAAVTGSTVPMSFQQVAHTYTTSSNSNHPASNEQAKAVTNMPSFQPAILNDYGGAAEQSEEEQEAEEDKEEEPVVKVVKGILKKSPERKSVGRGGRVRSSSAGGVRDSLEVARRQMGSVQEQYKQKKRGVRFADLTYSDEEGEEDMDDQDSSNQHSPDNKQNKQNKEVPLSRKPPRPVSAKLSTNTPKVDPSVKASRVASAGTLRRGIPRPKARNAATKNAVPSSVQSTNNATKPQTTSGNPSVSRVVNKGQANGADQNGNSPNKNAVYDSNGLRLDRTPTDDEINFLWENVRTCLSRQSSVNSNTETQSNGSERSNNGTRQGFTMAQKTFDGNSLAPKFQTATRLQSNIYVNNNRKKISMNNLNSYNKRTGITSNQQTEQGSVRASQSNGGGHGYQSTTTATHSQAPLSSSGYPSNPGGSTSQPHQYAPWTNNTANVSESMAGFLTAETLAQQSMAESEIEQAMSAAEHRQHSYNTTRPSHKVPSAISIEEQRLLQSLERLNERLKMTENAITPSPTSNYMPRPPPHRPGFRGHQPMIAHQRRNSATTGTVNRHHYRTGSAGSAHSNYTVTGRY